MLREPTTIETADGQRLEGELVIPDAPWAAAVLTHPHPRHGGNMRSMVPGELIEALPAMGVATLRFNFRGMGNSTGQFEDGIGERLDVEAAVSRLDDITEGLPLAVCGSSFGADTALSVDDERISGWCAMAPPLRDEKLDRMVAVARSDRPKLLIIAERDNFRLPDSVADVTASWVNTSTEIIPGADHFFVGRLEKVISGCCAFVRYLAEKG